MCGRPRGRGYRFNISANSLLTLKCFCAFMKTLEPCLGAERLQLFLGYEQARELRECILAIGKDQPVDVVDVRMGKSNCSNFVGRDIRFTQCLRNRPHAWEPSIRRSRIDQRNIVSIVNREGVDRQSQVPTDKAHLLRQVIAEYFIAGLTQSRDRHVDVAIT